ncbi:MAG: peptidylprolyl isomerase [Bacteroidota bacterium]
MKRICLLLILLSQLGFSQSQVIDKVIGIVGKYPILLSDLQNAMLEQETEYGVPAKCKTFEMLVFQKLLIAQAERDSITVTDAEVETELNRRMAHFIQQFGSEEKLERFYGKRTNVLKDEMRSEVHERLLAEKMNGHITAESKLTPAEIRNYYHSLPQDSLPFINSEVELQQLVKKPKFSAEAKKDAKDLLESYRELVLSGKSSMSIMARLYSEDPGSAKDGGLINNVAKNMMDPSFEAVAFRLKKGEISNVFESMFGYHFIELVERRGELLDLRHILIMPKMTNEDFIRAKKQLDSIHSAIDESKITFDDAVKKFSDDIDTKQNNGLMVNPVTASTKFDNEDLIQIDQNFVVTLNSMKVSDVSKPMQFSERDGHPAFRIVKLKNRIDPHKANLKDDYQRLMQMATREKNKNDLKLWIKKRSKITYIKLDPDYKCQFDNDWTISN